MKPVSISPRFQGRVPHQIVAPAGALLGWDWQNGSVHHHGDCVQTDRAEAAGASSGPGPGAARPETVHDPDPRAVHFRLRGHPQLLRRSASPRPTPPFFTGSLVSYTIYILYFSLFF